MELTVKDVARALSVSEEAVYRLVDERGLPVQQVDGQLRVHKAELLEWANAQGLSVASELFAAPGAVVLPSLAEALEAGGVVHGLAGGDTAAALRGLVAAMPLPEEVDREFLLSVLLAREALGSTGIGDGIAIPHPRNPIVLHVERPLVTLCFLSRPVDFGAVDGRPVYALFSLISPTPKMHLHLLSRLAYALRDPDCKATIARRADAATILGEIRRVEAGLGSHGTAR
ncbi:MAG: PTS sugar transporter subunit IIA [Thermoanaerobaculaceae bacterium]|nr:PTS sugar transporter subunit IIA [Thermoanaerobaculaceae bacterium]